MGNLLFSPSGRINSADFMKGVYVLIAISFVINIMPLVSFTIGTALGFAGIILIWCWIVLLVKRFHDGGKSGWMCLIPIILGIVLSMIIGSVVTGMFAGDLNAQLQEAAQEAGESGDIGAVFGASMEMGQQIAKKTAIPSAIAGALVSYIIAFVTDKMAGHDPDDNQFGPAT